MMEPLRVVEPIPSGLMGFAPWMTSQVLELAREMHAESGTHKYAPLDEQKLVQQLSVPITNPNVYLKFFVRDGEVLGTFFGVISSMFFSQELCAKDMAWFVRKSYRGTYAAVMLVRDFECWAKNMGVKNIFLGQSTGVKMETTAALYKRLGYAPVGTNTFKRIE